RPTPPCTCRRSSARPAPTSSSSSSCSYDPPVCSGRRRPSVFDWLSSYHQFLVDVTLIDILLVLSVVILFQSGLFSMATAGFAAIAGSTSGRLVTDAGWPTALGVPRAAVAGAVLATLFGLPVLRLRGIYLALGSLALSQVIVLGSANGDFTNGVFGISNIPQ